MSLRFFPLVSVVALIIGGFFLWRQIPLPCERPISYGIGLFDERFGLSRGAFLAEAQAAERILEDEVKRNLFEYVPEATFRINLIFDERQKQTFEVQKLEATLSETQSVQQQLETKQSEVISRYEAASKEYERLLVSYKKRLRAYNTEVEEWNRRGGAPPEVFGDLDEVSRALEGDRKELEAKRQEANRLAVKVNTFSDEQTSLVDAYNEKVESYIDRYGVSREFDQGEYVGEEINIYQYDDLPHLRAVLLHEFGHALGLGHGSDPRSLMFHLMRDQELTPLVLSEEDRSMLLSQCQRSAWDILWDRVQMFWNLVVDTPGKE